LFAFEDLLDANADHSPLTTVDSMEQWVLVEPPGMDVEAVEVPLLVVEPAVE
jgi:hypothetical protein